ncbi:Retrovirus-related Pol polyprotein from transposon TNT 1-94 [Nymphaea thermarum]|nr:Retrovirus-related Pol polyprotein from transposon TNT 1-94 [Nymphaea thermarum]
MRLNEDLRGRSLLLRILEPLVNTLHRRPLEFPLPLYLFQQWAAHESSSGRLIFSQLELDSSLTRARHELHNFDSNSTRESAFELELDSLARLNSFRSRNSSFLKDEAGRGPKAGERSSASIGSLDSLEKRSTKKSEGTVVKCYRCRKPGHIRKNCRTKFLNKKDNNGQYHNNRRKLQGDSDKEVICVVSECLFADGDWTGWWVDLGVTHHIAKTTECVIHKEELSPGTNKVYMGNNSYCDVMGIGTY